MLSPAANSSLDLRDSKDILSEHEEQRLSRSRRLTILETDSATSDILELLSDIEDSDKDQESNDVIDEESEAMGRAAANLMSNIVLSADFRCEKNCKTEKIQSHLCTVMSELNH